MPDTLTLLNNPVIWVILLMSVVCYANLVKGFFASLESADKQERVLQLNNTQTLLSSLPLLGLLGTIIGLLQTFAAMAQGIGNQAELMSAGIADAMYTTEMGLLMVIPGWLLLYQQRRSVQKAQMKSSLTSPAEAA